MRAGIPWIYGACVGALWLLDAGGARALTPCLRCLQDQLPAAGESPTCDSVGIIAPAVQMVAAWQVAEALKLLSGHQDRGVAASSCGPATCAAEPAAAWLLLAAWRDPACAGLLRSRRAFR